MSKANNLQPFRPPQFTPVVHPQKPQFIQLVEFPLTGQGMLGANTGVSKQMPHFPQSGEHLPCSGQAQPASQVVPMPYQPARPKSSAPLLSQQQPVFPGGYLPTRGVHIPSLSYICQPYSVPPPGVQARDTALDRSLPLVKSQMQHGHQPVSSSATLPSFGNAKVNSSEPSSSDWQDHTSTDGMKYYLNKKTRQSTWEKPVELMTPLELTQVIYAFLRLLR